MVHPATLARVVTELGGGIHEYSRVTELDTSGDGVVARTDAGLVGAPRAVLATNVFPSLLERDRLKTVPVSDYALMTEPLTDGQLDSIGWRNRQGLADLANLPARRGAAVLPRSEQEHQHHDDRHDHCEHDGPVAGHLAVLGPGLLAVRVPVRVPVAAHAVVQLVGGRFARGHRRSVAVG